MSMNWIIRSINADDTERIGELLASIIQPPEVIELRADLGGGKTTFTKGFVRGFGSDDRVGSPTFTLNKIYKGHINSDLLHLDGVQGADEQRTEPYLNTVKGVVQSVTQQSAKSTSRVASSASKQAGAVQEIWIHHFDFYRLDEAGVVAEQLAESLHNPKVVTIVEWADIVKGVLPEERITIEFKAVADNEDERVITFDVPQSKLEIIEKLRNKLAESQP
jgi:tRNA threonylcarbamoyl adenosine modification protein YjeE